MPEARILRRILLAVAIFVALVVLVRAMHSQDSGSLAVLAGASPGQIDEIMQAVSVSLGVRCEHCHVAGAFESDDVPAKQTARDMMRMVGELGANTFELLESPSCWTCHRGAMSPESVPPPAPVVPAIPFAPFSDSASPAGEVYDNVRLHGDLPAADLRAVMASYSRALGVGCDHCHVGGDWASDEKIEKDLSRVMIEMQRSIPGRFGLEGVTCWTCHRGDRTPQSNLPPALLPQ